jgi:NADP-dependent 3-hydroxy acid dehydrogenase YdfG
MNTRGLDVTLRTPFHIERAVLPGRYRRRRGVVVNLSSMHGVAAEKAAFLRRASGLLTNAISRVAGAARMAR